MGYASSEGCIRNSMRTNQLRVVYLDAPYVTQNQAAIAKVKEHGQSYEFSETCENPPTALPEW